jgi:hypothetical protein
MPQPEPDETDLSPLARIGRDGPRDIHAAHLARQQPIGHLRLTLAAAQFARRVARRPDAIPEPCSGRDQFMMLNALLELGHIDAARAFVDRTPDTGVTLAGLHSLRALTRAAPRRDPDAPGPDVVDEPDRDVAVAARPGAPLAVFVFTGAARRFAAPVPLAHEWFRRLPASIIYVRDAYDMFYLAGIRGFGAGYRAAADGLAGLAADLGARRIVCIGNSAGGYGALRFGLDLGAARVACLSGPTIIDASLPRLRERRRKEGLAADDLDAGTLDLAALYGAAARRPSLRLVFGADNAGDRAEAEGMAKVPDALLLPLDGVAAHGILPDLVARGGFEPLLAWLTGEDA